jgi:hypothetical protein
MGISCGQCVKTFFIPNYPQFMHGWLPGFRTGYDIINYMIYIVIHEL